MKFVVKNLIGYLALDLLYQSGIIVFLFNQKLKYPNDTIPFFYCLGFSGLEIPIFVILFTSNLMKELALKLEKNTCLFFT